MPFVQNDIYEAIRKGSYALVNGWISNELEMYLNAKIKNYISLLLSICSK